MAPKRNVTDVRWVDKNIVSHIPAELLANDQALAKAIETWNNAKDVKSLPTVCYSPFVSSLVRYLG